MDAVDSGEACLERLSRQPYDVVVLDIWLPRMDGLATLTRMREREIDAEVVIISGHGSVEAAVRAIKMGAFDFVEKPLSLDKTVLVVRNALRQRRLQAENIALRAKVDAQHTMVGESHAMARLRDQIALAAPSNGRVLIFGENGTGKELVARNIHAMSRRRSGAVRRGQLRRHPRGADRERALRPRARRVHRRGGRSARQVRAAHGGTIFLDEIGDMSLKTQAKVLRVLQEQMMEAVGGSTRIRVDARVLAATNKDLTEEIRARALPRGPLLPPQRRADLRAAAARAARGHPAAGRSLHGAAGARVRPPRQDVRGRGGGGAAALRLAGQRPRAAQPGRAADDHGAGRTWSPPATSRCWVRRGRSRGAAATRRRSRSRRCTSPATSSRRRYILRALASQHGNMSKTADVLGVERSNLYRKMRGFGIGPPRKPDDDDA